MPVRHRKTRTTTLVAVFSICLLVALFALRERERPASLESLPEGTHRVARVIDGDTILLDGGSRVRLLGIDSPESVKPDHPIEPWGREAAAFAREFLSGGEARLRFDRERKDRYGRFLAYVYVGDRLLNEELVREGLARAVPRYRYSETMKRRFLKAQVEAKAARRGIWSGK